MKKNIIITILTTSIILLTILAIIGINMENKIPLAVTPVINANRDAFIDGCTSEDGKYGYCSCVYDTATEKYGETKTNKLFIDLATTEKISDEVMKLIIKCLPLNK
jgi:hypothetical protein